MNVSGAGSRLVGDLVRFLADGGDSEHVRQELTAIESSLQGLRVALAEVERTAGTAPPRVHPSWVRTKLEQLEALVQSDPVRAKVEIGEHLDGELTIFPRPAPPGQRRAEIIGRVKANGLLSEQEAVRLEVVAGVGFEPTTFGL